MVRRMTLDNTSEEEYEERNMIWDYGSLQYVALRESASCSHDSALQTRLSADLLIEKSLEAQVGWAP